MKIIQQTLKNPLKIAMYIKNLETVFAHSCAHINYSNFLCYIHPRLIFMKPHMLHKNISIYIHQKLILEY